MNNPLKKQKTHSIKCFYTCNYYYFKCVPGTDFVAEKICSLFVVNYEGITWGYDRSMISPINAITALGQTSEAKLVIMHK